MVTWGARAPSVLGYIREEVWSLDCERFQFRAGDTAVCRCQGNATTVGGVCLLGSAGIVLAQGYRAEEFTDLSLICQMSVM